MSSKRRVILDDGSEHDHNEYTEDEDSSATLASPTEIPAAGRNTLFGDDVVRDYHGEDFVDAGPVSTPAQHFGAAGLLDPSATPWPQLPPAVFLQHLHMQVANVQGHRTEQLLREIGLVLLGHREEDKLPYILNPPPFPEWEELQAIHVRAAAISNNKKSTGTASSGTAGSRPPTSTTGARDLPPPVAHYSSRVDPSTFDYPAAEPVGAAAHGMPTYVPQAPPAVPQGRPAPPGAPFATPASGERSGATSNSA
ncbi:hypothetical protein CC85DRAFT_300423 [Cutaneotrichosporon oleaginosum]|uniref:Uncharacterized protein n=1 Tax=Cutaneotrichosporon oleaginosum TaxID=879819 RepID=A0A0J1B9Q5_9TREE|nr:uncharacterized protein CC85DRAFT_300423 [Cutaneotrichosporon oleaginosum]KLT44584.1 hypothetical protein CC85DRAFT_300423 [Cutaneotrichosporon oleaginosum]TXT13901.1 hypothetical protein COLE_00094 [Cutaneotrichosporon oleaginosum]